MIQRHKSAKDPWKLLELVDLAFNTRLHAVPGRICAQYNLIEMRAACSWERTLGLSRAVIEAEALAAGVS